MRAFSEFSKRQVLCLDGAWQFAIDPDGVGADERWFDGLPSSRAVAVPSVWNTQLGLLEYEGAAFYQRKFRTAGGNLRFVFGAVLTEATVWLDGELLGEHYGGFTQFEFVVYGVSAGEHILTVRVDNSFDEHSVPQTEVDWYHYGGIIRPVTVETLRGVVPLSTRMEYDLDVASRRAVVRFVTEVINTNETETETVVSAEVMGVEFAAAASIGARERCEVSTEYKTLEGLELWSQESPKLYTARVYTPDDDLLERVGFRKVEVDGSRILLNGEPIEFRGVNRHEEHAEFGFAFPPALMARDLDLIADLGCNTIRGSHYPNNPIFLDMLDERGFTFYSEIPIWGHGFRGDTLGDPIIVDRAANMHIEMVKQYYNHPSIIIWGMHNEIDTSLPDALEMTKRYYKLLKETGGNRLVTYAGDRPLTDICLKYCDIICINKYNGWYSGTISLWAETIEKMFERFAEVGVEGKPLIISEFGAGAVYGHRSFDTVRWSEDYQAKLLEHCITLFRDDPRIAGCYIWQFTDIRTCRDMGLTRARQYNNKGILNEHRNPKAAYFKVKEIYTAWAKR